MAKSQQPSIDFANPEAVKLLNKALLAHHYQLEHWDIPPQYLCPPIPSRADYIHYIADLLAESNEDVLPTGDVINGLDIGVGANCVYPIIGHQSYRWRFVGSDIDTVAVKSANRIVEQNAVLQNAVSCRLQSYEKQFFKGIIQADEFFDFTLCNPPFHASDEEAKAGNRRKWKNLGNKKNSPVLNFGGQPNELYYDGGEYQFIKLMITESREFSKNCYWFSTLVSKKDNLVGIYKTLKWANATEVKTIEMTQGQKVSRVVAWTFLDDMERDNWRKSRW